MKIKFILFFLAVFIVNSNCFSNDYVRVHGGGLCDTVNFDYKKVNEINLKDGYLNYNNQKIIIFSNDILEECKNIFITNKENPFKFLPEKCIFLIGDACEYKENNIETYEVWQYECNKNGCEKLNVFTEYSDPDVE